MSPGADRDPTDRDPRPLGRTSPPFEPRPVTLRGRLIRLEPLEARHAAELAEIALDEETWRWTRDRIETRADVDRYLAAALEAAAARAEIPFAQVDAVTGHAAGMTRLHSIEHAHRRLEIGHTWLAAPWRGTGHNAEAKLLLLGYAFDDLGANRVEFKTDALNLRSQAALEAIGATREGTLRRHVVTESGRVRDSVYYSVTWDEWPAVRRHLVARVDDAVAGLRRGPAR